MPLTKEELTAAVANLWSKIARHMYVVLVLEAVAALVVGYLVGRAGH
jgi:hypothetical protein